MHQKAAAVRVDDRRRLRGATDGSPGAPPRSHHKICRPYPPSMAVAGIMPPRRDGEHRARGGTPWPTPRTRPPPPLLLRPQSLLSLPRRLMPVEIRGRQGGGRERNRGCTLRRACQTGAAGRVAVAGGINEVGGGALERTHAPLLPFPPSLLPSHALLLPRRCRCADGVEEGKAHDWRGAARRGVREGGGR